MTTNAHLDAANGLLQGIKVCVCSGMHVFGYVCVWVCMCLGMCVFGYACVWVCVCLGMHVFGYVCKHEPTLAMPRLFMSVCTCFRKKWS
jgi:hypothetical protein